MTRREEVVFSLDIALGGGFAISVQGFARVEPGGESAAEGDLGSSIARLSLLFNRGHVAHSHGKGAAQIVLGKDWMSEQQGEDLQLIRFTRKKDGAAGVQRAIRKRWLWQAKGSASF